MIMQGISRSGPLPSHPGLQQPHLSFPSDSMSPPSAFDPANDFRTFYPYIPNEVKHRKRTTRSQQAVLEQVFQSNTKPNAALRKELALQLDMQARGVQVWFQNRRAKEKKKDTSIKSAPKSTRTSTPSEDHSADDASLNSSPEIDHVPDTPAESVRDFPIDINVNVLSVPIPDESSPSNDVPPSLSRQRSLPDSLPNQGLSGTTPSGGLKVPDAHLLGLRRGSLPVNAFAQSSLHATSLGPPAIDSIDPLARRRSIDTGIHRLAHHPYARLAMEKNGLMAYGPSINSYGRMSHIARPSMMHRGSLPGPTLNTHVDQYHYPTSAISSASSSSPLSPPYRFRGPRMMASGPLPSPSYSFGAPLDPLSPTEEQSDASAEHLAYTFPPSDREEDEMNSASHSVFSRGSIVSLGSETSATSAYFSDVGSSPNFGSRRGSCVSTGFLELVNGLDVNSVDVNSDHTSSSYPSPTPTIAAPVENEPTFTISKSSELAFALTGKDVAPPTKQVSPSPEPSVMETAPAPHYYFADTSLFTPSEPNTSSCALPVEFTNPFETVSSTGNYHATPSFADGSYTSSGHYTTESQAYGAGHHGASTADMFGAAFRSGNELSAAGMVSSSCGDGGLHVGDSFVAFA